jgi:hypothetical protein
VVLLNEGRRQGVYETKGKQVQLTYEKVAIAKMDPETIGLGLR